MTVEIPLTQGKVALIDDEDYRMLAEYKWYAHVSGTRWYAQTNIPRGKGQFTLLMHRLITAASGEVQVDHIDHDGLNNTRANLRLCAQIENSRNRLKQCKGPITSQFKGVGFHKISGRWRARIGFNGKEKYLGYFDDEADAARAYNEAATELFGEFAYLNEIAEP